MALYFNTFLPWAGGVARMRIRSWELYGGILLAFALTIAAAPRSSAQEISPAGEYKEGIALGSWMAYPSIFLGGEYDSNFNQSPSGPQEDKGGNARVSPRLTASYDGGIHKVALYGVVDASFFNGQNLAASAGFQHTYEAQQDLIVGLYGNYTRQTDIFNSAWQFNNNAIGPPATQNTNIPIIINPFGTTPGVNPIAYNQFGGTGSITKTFDQAFVSLSASGYTIIYDNNDSVLPPFQTSHDGSTFWFSGRLGYNFPQFYVFAQGDYILQRFDNSVFNTNGYRVIGGIGRNDPSGLFRGEVYGGYQFQHQEQQFVPAGIPVVPVFGFNQDASTSVFGGRLSYYPTPYWTIIAQADEILGMSTTLGPTTPFGIPTRTITAILQTTYGLSRSWSVGVRGGYTRGEFIGVSGLNNQGWLVGASFNYEIWRNLMLTLDYQYTTVNSDAQFSEFTRNRYTAGVTYRY
jgi:hypothetical protein